MDNFKKISGPVGNAIKTIEFIKRDVKDLSKFLGTHNRHIQKLQKDIKTNKFQNPRIEALEKFVIDELAKPFKYLINSMPLNDANTPVLIDYFKQIDILQEEIKQRLIKEREEELYIKKKKKEKKHKKKMRKAEKKKGG